MPILGRTMVGIFPFFIGAVLLAISLFSASYRFHDASYASINLYSMIAGDELQDVFRDLTSMNLLTAIVFLYIYVFFGIVAIITCSSLSLREDSARLRAVQDLTGWEELRRVKEKTGSKRTISILRLFRMLSRTINHSLKITMRLGSLDGRTAWAWLWMTGVWG